MDDEERDFYVRQLWDGKRSVEVETLPPEGLEIYGRVCGWTLARAHARSGDRIAIAAYLGKGESFDRAIADFSERYADQNELDYARPRRRGQVGAHRGGDGLELIAAPNGWIFSTPLIPKGMSLAIAPCADLTRFADAEFRARIRMYSSTAARQRWASMK